MARTAILVGVGKYDSGLPRLNAPEQDVAAVAAAFGASQHDRFQSTCLVDCKSDDAINCIEMALSRSSKDDEIVIYFSGHGYLDVAGCLWLCFSNTNTTLLTTTAYSWQILRQRVVDSAARVVILILDCCHSGAAKGQALPDLTIAGNGRIRLSSCLGSESAKDALVRGDLSPYTKILCEGLVSDSLAGDKKYVSVSDLVAHISRASSRLVSTPTHMIDGTGDVALTYVDATTVGHLKQWSNENAEAGLTAARGARQSAQYWPLLTAGAMAAIAATLFSLADCSDSPKWKRHGEVVLWDGMKRGRESVFRFSTGQVGQWNQDQADIGVSMKVRAGNIALFLPYDEAPYPNPQHSFAEIVDLGRRELDDVKTCPSKGYSHHWMNPVVGNVYCVRLADRSGYAKMRILEIVRDGNGVGGVRFAWAL